MMLMIVVGGRRYSDDGDDYWKSWKRERQLRVKDDQRKWLREKRNIPLLSM